jgi:hypothetical protein
MAGAALAKPGDEAQLVIGWEPQEGPQAAFVTCPVYEIFFGGARGGGKTDAVLGEWAIHSDEYGKDAIGLMVRRSRVELLETIERARRIYAPLGATFTATPARVVMPGGGRLTFAYLERDSDAEAYQGHSYTRVYVEEAGNFPSPAPIMKLHATLRSGAGVPVGMRLTGNPGGPGHQWVRARYIDPAPMGWMKFADEQSGLERIYIPSRVSDNHFLGGNYVAQIKASGTPQLVKAWLEGDWSIIAGAYFPEWSNERHVIAPRALPDHWLRYRAFDWGSARPFCCLWIAVSDGEVVDIPRGALVVYREWYGSTGQPNEGLRLTAEEVAAGIAAREAGDPVHVDAHGMKAPRWGVADPAIFTSDGGPSIAERMFREAKITWRAADNARVSRHGAMGGWDQVRARLKGVDEKPSLYVFATCTHLIRTLPALQHDEHRPEDVDTEGEDHAPDTLRYGCMARPFVRDAVKPDRGRIVSVGAGNEAIFNDLWKTAPRPSARI